MTRECLSAVCGAWTEVRGVTRRRGFCVHDRAWAEARGVTRRRGLCVHDPRVPVSSGVVN